MNRAGSRSESQLTSGHMGAEATDRKVVVRDCLKGTKPERSTLTIANISEFICCFRIQEMSIPAPRVSLGSERGKKK